MAALHEALTCLSPASWESVPTGNPADLRAYIADIRTKAQLIVDSVPEPPLSSEEPHIYSPSSSSSSSKTVQVRPSPARLNKTDSTTLSHQKEWSKPVKISNEKDNNPFGVSVFKLPGADGKGHWFSRRSVHEGLSFSVWQEKLSGEIPETLRVNQKRMSEGKPPDWSVRGIGAERLVEEVRVLDEKGERELGRVEVFHVSAQFPKPTTARDFVPMIISWEVDQGLCGRERKVGVEAEDEGEEGRGGRAGRSWMMVSRPCFHPDVPNQHGYLRGEYESVEMVREILVDEPSKLNEVDAEREGEGEKEVSNPVEWIMVTRSDPGGNIPRWMVEKGTPKSICTDTAKFVNWACRGTGPATKRGRLRRSTDKSESSQQVVTGVHGSEEDTNASDSAESESESEPEEHHGLIASMAYLLRAGLERYAPQAVLDYMPQPARRSSSPDLAYDTDEEHKTPTDHQPTKEETEPQDDETRSQPSIESEPNTVEEVSLDVSPVETIQQSKKGKLSTHEKHLAKLAQQKRSVEAQLERVRRDIQSLRLRPSEEDVRKEKAAALASADGAGSSDRPSRSPASSTRRSDDRSSSSGNLRSRSETHIGDNAKMHKVATALFHDESKLLRQLDKIERHQAKEAAKVETRQRKEAEREEKHRSRAEVEILRHEVENLKKECEKLKSERRKWLDLIGSLQTENTRLAAQVGAGETK